MSDVPLVSVVVPAYRADGLIAGCLASVLSQVWPREQLEVIVVDGGSDDATRETARAVLAASGLERWRVEENLGRTIPSNLNVALDLCSGELLVRVDVRSRLPARYIAESVRTLLDQPEVRVVGGAQVAVPTDGRPKDVGIARGLNNRLAMGGSRYRRGARSGRADTVYLGVYRTSDVRAVGGWSDELLVNEDFDLNQRLAELGMVWFDANLAVEYVPRDGLRSLWRQYRTFGLGKVVYWRERRAFPSHRQLVVVAVPPIAGAALLLAFVNRRWRRRILPIGLAVGAAVEHFGVQGPAGGLRARLWSVVTSATVASAWFVGVVTGLVRPTSSP